MVSIIVPVYNAAQSLSRCLDSILNQSYSDIEIILINDGSTDKSAEICEEYVAKHSNIIYASKANGGVSSARNCGLNMVSGDWLTFCDSDDTLPLNAIEVLVAKTNGIFDCVVGGYRELNFKGEILYETAGVDEVIIDSKSALMDLYVPIYFKYNGYLVNRLFKMAIIKEMRLQFNENIHYREDGLFITEFLCFSKKNLCYTSTPVYNYYMNPSSAMMTLEHTFPSKFLTELDSRIFSEVAIRKSYSIFDYKLRYWARKSVIEGYDWIISLMDKHLYYDKDVRNGLCRKMINSVTLPFYILFRLYKKIRRIN